MILVRFEGAVDGAAFGCVSCDGDGDGFGVRSWIRSGSTFADDGFAVSSDDDGADRRSWRDASGSLFGKVEGAAHEIHALSM